MAVIQRPEAVGNIQELLEKIGYDTGGKDGVWGRDTSAGFNHFVNDVQAHVFPDQPDQRDGLYGTRTHEAVQGQLQQMYGDRLSAEEIQRLSTALAEMTEKVDPNGRPNELGRPLINRLHTPVPLTTFESKITPRPVEAAPVVEAEPEPVVEAEPVVAQPLPVVTRTEPETEYEEVVVNGQPTLALPEAEPQPVQPIEAAFAGGLSDAQIIADAEALTRRASESFRFGATSGLGGTDNGQTQALGRVADAAGDPLLTAQASTQVMGDVIANLDLQQRNLVASNTQLADLVRAAHPDVGATPEAVVAKLREPGVAAALLAGGATDGNLTGERALVREFIDMERERLGAVRVQGVMSAEQTRLEAVAAGVEVTAVEPATPQMPEDMLDRMADIERQQGELMRVNFLTGETGASDTLVAERIANMRDPEKFNRLRDHLVETGNTAGITALDQFKALEDTRRGLQTSFENAVPAADAAVVTPVSADQRISQAFEAASAMPVNPELQIALERKAAEMRNNLGAGPQ